MAPLTPLKRTKSSVTINMPSAWEVIPSARQLQQHHDACVVLLVLLLLLLLVAVMYVRCSADNWGEEDYVHVHSTQMHGFSRHPEKGG